MPSKLRSAGCSQNSQRSSANEKSSKTQNSSKWLQVHALATVILMNDWSTRSSGEGTRDRQVWSKHVIKCSERKVMVSGNDLYKSSPIDYLILYANWSCCPWTHTFGNRFEARQILQFPSFLSNLTSDWYREDGIIPESAQDMKVSQASWW